MVNFPCTLSYKIPESWASSGRSPSGLEYTAIRVNMRSLSEFGNYNIYETTYDDFLEDYIENKRNTTISGQYAEFRRRSITLANGEEYPILEEVSYGITNHMVFVFKGNVLSIEITLGEDKYNEENLKKIDNIFSSAFVFY